MSMVSRASSPLPPHSPLLTYRATDSVHFYTARQVPTVFNPSLLTNTPLQTYGPFTRNHLQESWLALPLEERAKRMARQGYSYNTADGARVVYQTEGEDLEDVPPDGKTIGEIIVRGNLVMKQVHKRLTGSIPSLFACSDIFSRILYVVFHR